MAIVRLKNKTGITYQVKLRGSDGKWITHVFPTKKQAQAEEVKIKNKINNGNLITKLR